MSKYQRRQPENNSGKIITTKSGYGSHADMVIDPLDEEIESNIRKAVMEEGQVVCKDDYGYYITYRDNLDSGLADPCRYSSKHRL
jgi:hypothetical protein